ncbi:hypothetical protein POTOM_030766 [Populus tomentosa]|uniref:Uncharacterized protein n=1 Tax=Populus tomentosa TaxID=118781 RepID=A0A8X7Z9G1_POPTO|nr:hypothetical protein POTOM_030766 [Populus tomentosa]
MPSRRGRSAAMIIPSKHAQKDPSPIMLKIALSDYVPVARISQSMYTLLFSVNLTEGRIYTGNVYICGREEGIPVVNKHRNGIEDHDTNGSCSYRSPNNCIKDPIPLDDVHGQVQINQNIHFLELTREAQIGKLKTRDGVEGKGAGGEKDLLQWQIPSLPKPA